MEIGNDWKNLDLTLIIDIVFTPMKKYLNKRENNLEIISEKSLEKLTSAWNQENKDQYSIFTDIIILKWIS